MTNLTKAQRAALVKMSDGKSCEVFGQTKAMYRRMADRGLLKCVWPYRFEITQAGRDALK